MAGGEVGITFAIGCRRSSGQRASKTNGFRRTRCAKISGRVQSGIRGGMREDGPQGRCRILDGRWRGFAPGLPPMVGKAKISAWLDSLTPQLAGAKMDYCTVDWQDIRIQGDLAYEWGINRQKIEFPAPGKPFEGNGKILLILKLQQDGR